MSAERGGTGSAHRAGNDADDSPLTAAEARVLSAITPAAVTALTVRLVNAGGENPPGLEQASAEALRAAAAELGLSSTAVDVAPGRPNVTVELPATSAGTVTGAAGTEPAGPGTTGTHPGPGLMFLGHSDVVPAGTGWSHDPFDAVVADGRITGRGACDMKGGLAAVLLAMSALRTSGHPLTGPISLVCTVDEEDLDTGIRAWVESARANEPAGTDRGDTAGGSGSAQQWAGCVVAEPTNMETVIACRGDCYLRMRVTGVPAHSGRPADGRSAIAAAARIIELIRADQAALDESPEDLIGAGSWNVGTINGGQATTTVPAHCDMTIDRRLLPSEDPERVRRDLLAAIDAADITGDGIAVNLELVMTMPGFHTAADHPLTTTACDALAAVGLQPHTTGWTAACDGGFIARDLRVPTIVLGPGDLNTQAHQVDESVAIDDLVAAARAYALIALRLLG